MAGTIRGAAHAGRKALVLIWMVASLAGCGLLNAKDADPTAKMTPAEIHAAAKEELEAGRYGEAVKLLGKLESRYPFGIWAQQAQLDTAYAHYKDNDRAQGLVAIERFMRLHPNHAQLDYAYYLKGLINFNDEQGLLQRLGGQDLSERDQLAAREAYEAFNTLVTRFPTSVYVTDAQARMRYLRQSMASGDLAVARFYFSRGAYLAAIARAQSVIEQEEATPAAEQALWLLVRAYDKLNMTTQRDDAQKLLDHNFPESSWRTQPATLTQGARWWAPWR